MRTFLAFLGTLVCLFQSTLSASDRNFDKFSSLSIGERAYLGVKSLQIRLYPVKPNGVFSAEIAEANVSYDPSVPIEDVTRQEVLKFAVVPRAGMENYKHAVQVTTGWILQFDSQQFMLEKTTAGWNLGTNVFTFKISYNGLALRIPTAVGFEIRGRKNGKPLVLSTITGENSFPQCAMDVIRDDAEKGVIQLIDEFVESGWTERTLTIFESLDKFGTFDKNGLFLSSSTSLPSFYEEKPWPPEIRPLSLAIVRSTDGNLEVSVTGDGAESAVVEETVDLRNWGVAHSLSSPPRVLSTGERHQTVTFSGGGPRFYRARLSDGLRKR